MITARSSRLLSITWSRISIPSFCTSLVLGRCADIGADQVVAHYRHQMPLADIAKAVQQVGHLQRHRGLAYARVAGEGHVQRRRFRGQPYRRRALSTSSRAAIWRIRELTVSTPIRVLSSSRSKSRMPLSPKERARSTWMGCGIVHGSRSSVCSTHTAQPLWMAFGPARDCRHLKIGKKAELPLAQFHEDLLCGRGRCVKALTLRMPSKVAGCVFTRTAAITSRLRASALGRACRWKHS